VHVADANLEIGSHQLEVTFLSLAFCLEKNVGEDGHGIPLFDDGLEAGEPTMQVGFLDGQLHGFSSSSY
jgi:hypothetical protein